MIHLFDQAYIHHDIFGIYSTKSRERLFITNATFPVPLASDRSLRKKCLIRGVFQELQECDNEFGGRENFWKYLVEKKPDISLIVDSYVSTELMVQLWKSIYDNHTYETIRTLYLLTINNENRLAFSSTQENIETTGFNVEENLIFEPMSEEDFKKIYDRVQPVQCLKELLPSSLSIELLLVSYLVGDDIDEVKTLLFEKIERILTKSYYEHFVGTALLLQRRFGNLNRSVYDGTEISFCPFTNIGKLDWLKWIISPNIQSRKMDAVRKEFSIEKILELYRDIKDREIFAYKDEVEDAIYLGELLLNKNYAKIIEEDQSENTKRSSVFSDSRFRDKINPLLISYIYRLKRVGKKEDLIPFSVF